jgi:hypothetical protein
MKTAAEPAKMEMDQHMQIHRDVMDIQKQEIDTKMQAINLQMSQHADKMKM